jgi:hypothetical protein
VKDSTGEVCFDIEKAKKSNFQPMIRISKVLEHDVCLVDKAELNQDSKSWGQKIKMAFASTVSGLRFL